MTASFLDVIESCDNLKVTDHRDELALFCLSGDPSSLATPVGLLWPEVVQALQDDNTQSQSEGQKTSWVFITDSKSGTEKVTHVHFAPHLTDHTSRSAALATTCTRWRDSGKFANTIGGRKWRNELYPIYKEPFRGVSPESAECAIERAAAALFGLVTYGVHMTVYQKPAPGTQGEVMLWVPTRSKTKATYVFLQLVSLSLSGNEEVT